ncbi:Vti1a [Symbiodinium microadriaticum]|nr:Vti1a [Symbiodinium microadriaticum]
MSQHVTVSEMFTEYEADFTRLCHEAEECLERAKSTSSAKPLSDADRCISRAEQAVKQMELEVRAMPPEARGPVQSKVQECRRALTERRKASEAVSRAMLLEETTLGKPTSEHTAEDMNQSMLEGSRKLTEAKRAALESEQIGIDVMSDLRQQREVMERSRENMGKVGQNYSAAGHTLDSMLRRADQNKRMVYMIAGLMLVMLVVAVYFLFHGAAGRLDSLLVQHGLNISLVLIGSSEVLFRSYQGRTAEFFAQVDFATSKGVLEAHQLSGTKVMGQAIEISVMDPGSKDMARKMWNVQRPWETVPEDQEEEAATNTEPQGVQAEYFSIQDLPARVALEKLVAMTLTYWEKWNMVWLAANFYIHFGWEISLLNFFDYAEWKGGFKSWNPFCQAFFSYGDYDRRYKLKPPADYHGTKASIDKVVLAVEVPAGIIDGALCCMWLKGILDNAWYRYPVQLVVSALHAFGTVVFWSDELVPGWMNWMRGKGWKWTHTDGPKSIHWWWAFIGSNLVWVVVPMMYAKSAIDVIKPAMQALKN